MTSARGNILDLRPTELHESGHLPGSATLPIERQLALQQAHRRENWLACNLPSIFLPPRHEPLLVVTEAPDLACLVAAHLTDRGRAPVAALALNRHVFEFLDADLRCYGRSRRMLWRPPHILQRWVHLLPPPVAGGVLDLACGSGRAAVWLAGQGWQVTGIDHQPEALSLATRLAANSGVRLDLRVADLRERAGLPHGPWATILLLRFLERGLVKRLPTRLRRGGVVVLSTFRNAPGFLGNPRLIHRLRRDEAATFWPGDLMEILVHQEGFDGDGQPTSSVVGRRL